MTREQIEKALLTTGFVEFGHDDYGEPIALNGPRGRRLAQVVFGHLRSSKAFELKDNKTFFDALEAAFLVDNEDGGPDPRQETDTIAPRKTVEQRTWRLKKIETKGFGGLNVTTDDVFEFDMAGRDYCIEGQNGSGKTSLANAVLFAMTGTIHRDQHGLWGDPGRLEPVISDKGEVVGTWPPIASYPDDWSVATHTVDVSVELTFGNEIDNDEIQARRRLHGEPGALQQEVNIDSRLTAVPTLVEAGLTMPMRIQHIRVPQTDDNSQLVGLIRQLIGLEPLLEVAQLVDDLTHGNKRFLKYAREHDMDGKAQQVPKLLHETQETIRNLRTSFNLTVEIERKKAIPEIRIKELAEIKKELDRKQVEGFQTLSGLAFQEFDPDQEDHRQQVAKAINQLSVDIHRQNDSSNLPPVLAAVASLAKQVGKDDSEGLKTALRQAPLDVNAAVNWASRQKKDTLLRLKAVAASHFDDCEEPLCPLCQQSLKGFEHRNLVEDLRTLKSDAEAAQARVGDACRRIERNLRSAAQRVVPDMFMRVGRFAVKKNIKDHVRLAYIEATHIAVSLPGFARVGTEAVSSAFEAVDEFELGSKLPNVQENDELGRIRRLVDHLEDILNAAENWKHSRGAYRQAWTNLFSFSSENSLAGRIQDLKGVIDGVKPFRSASQKVEQALGIAVEYNAVVSRQVLRERIASDLRPLRKLRDLVNWTARQTILDVSEVAKEIHEKIYNVEPLSFEKTDVSEYRGKQSLTFRGKLGKGLDWQIDASLLANVSWMRGVLWSFVFAIRERAIQHAGGCPFQLMVLDDPQITFDTRNVKGWASFLGRANGLRGRQACQVLVTTHSRLFGLEMTPMHDIQMAAIETGQPWSNPAQVVIGDFAVVRFGKMKAENSDERARLLIGDIRVLAETLLKHALEPFDPVFVRKPEATFGAVFERVAQRAKERQPPYTGGTFGQLLAVRSSHPERFNELSEPHHTVSEAITVREANLIYSFWQEALFPALRRVWEEYRFLQKSIVGEVAAIALPGDCTHNPIRSRALACVQPTILGRVSAYSDGRAATGMKIDRLSGGDVLDFSSLAAYRLEKDTLSPVAQIGDILLTRLDAQCRASNLVVEDRGTYRVARRWHEDTAAPALAVLAASCSNPREVPGAVISRSKGANRRKIIGVLFAADQLKAGGTIDSKSEATDLEADSGLVSELVADTDVFEVQGSSAEPIALDNQYLVAKRPRTDMATALRELDGKPVIAEDSEECAYFKRLRVFGPKSIMLESLDKTGVEGLIRLSADSAGPDPVLTRIREVVGVIFDKL